MAKEPKMKIGIGADTGDFEKGARKVKQEMKDLNKVSSDAFAAIGSAIGLDTRQIQQFSSALAGLGNKLAQTGAEGSSAFSKIGSAVTSVGAGIAGLGLAAAIAAFKQLNAEADAFEQTIQGGVIKAQTEAFTSTFAQALRDQSGVGGTAASWRQDWQEIWAVMKGAIKTGFDTDRMREATQLAGRAKEIATDLYNIELQRKNNSVQIAELDAQIAQKREIISDRTRSAAERSAALAEAQDLIKEKLNIQLPLAKEQARLLGEYNSLASTTIKEYDAEISAKIQVNNLIQQEAAEQRSLLRQQQQINNELKQTVQVRKEAIGGVGSTTTSGLIQVPVELIADKRSLSNIKELAEFELGGLQFTVDFEMDAEKWQAIANQISSGVKNAMTSATVAMGQAIGQLIGDLATGQDAWGNFANAAVSAFGDLAISLGKIAIEAGAEVIALNAALKTMSVPAAYLAIAAGTALVILGSAVKSGMANLANGNYSSGAGAVSSGSTYSSALGNFEQRDVYVNVTGTLRADGNQLVAVLNNTNKKNKVTT